MSHGMEAQFPDGVFGPALPPAPAAAEELDGAGKVDLTIVVSPHDFTRIYIENPDERGGQAIKNDLRDLKEPNTRSDEFPYGQNSCTIMDRRSDPNWALKTSTGKKPKRSLEQHLNSGDMEELVYGTNGVVRTLSFRTSRNGPNITEEEAFKIDRDFKPENKKRRVLPSLVAASRP